MPLVVSYLRFSSSKQELSSSVKQQLDDQEKFLREHPELTLADTLTDLGISAWKPTNNNRDSGALAHFIKEAEQGKVPKGTILLLSKYDRLSRDNFDDAYFYLQSIVRLGIKVHVMETGITLDEVNIKDFGTSITVMASFLAANQESTKKSDRVGKARKYEREAQRESGAIVSSRCPAYLSVKKNKAGHKTIITEYIIKEDAHTTIKIMFQKYNEGFSLRHLTEYLNKHHKPFTAAIEKYKYDTDDKRVVLKERKKPVFTFSYVRNLLSDRRLLGELQQYKIVNGKREKVGLPIEHYYPKLIDEQTFNTAQYNLIQKRRFRKPNEHFENIFTGLITDDFGHTYFVKKTVDRGTNRYRLQSSGAANGLPEDKCRRTTFEYFSFEYLIFEAIQSIDPSEFFTSKEQNTTAQTKQQIEVVKKKIEGLTAALQNLTEPNTIGLYAQMLEAANKELEQLKKQDVSNSASSATSPDQVLNLIDKIKELPKNEQATYRRKLKLLLPTIIEKIKVRPTLNLNKKVANTFFVLFKGKTFRFGNQSKLKGVNGTLVLFDKKDNKIGTFGPHGWVHYYKEVSEAVSYAVRRDGEDRTYPNIQWFKRKLLPPRTEGGKPEWSKAKEIPIR